MLKFIRIILAIPCMAITSIVTLLICFFFPFKRWTTFYIARILGHPLLWLWGIKANIVGLSEVKKSQPCIFVSNHQSNIDLFLVGSTCPKRTVSLGKRSIIYFPLFGLVYWLSGQILINRSNKSSAYRSMDKVARIVNNDNVSIWIMPEGTRSRGKGLQKFKKGAFLAAISSKRPIVPVSISSYAKDFNLNKWKSTEVIVKFHEPIETADYSMDNIEQLIERTRTIILKEICEGA